MDKDQIESWRNLLLRDYAADDGITDPINRTQLNALCDLALMALRAAPGAEREVDSFGRDLRKQNLAMAVRRLVQKVRQLNINGDVTVANQAVQLLRDMDLLGSPLRADPTEGACSIVSSYTPESDEAEFEAEIVDSIMRRLPQKVVHISKARDLELRLRQAQDIAMALQLKLGEAEKTNAMLAENWTNTERLLATERHFVADDCGGPMRPISPGISRAEWHDKAWALFHAKTFDDKELHKVNIHTIRAVFDATYDALGGKT